LGRTESGKGEHIDLAMLDVQVGLLANQAMNYLISGKTPQRTGTAHPNIQPQRTFACRDGQMIMVVGNDNQFNLLCQVIGRPELSTDERFATNGQRVRNQAVLDPILDAILLTQDRSFWLEKLAAAGVPSGSINTIPEVFQEPQVVHRQMLRSIPHPVAGDVPQVMSPLRFAQAPLKTDVPPPTLGQHTREVLAGLGYSEAQMDQLHERSVT
jgi:crotonobetainyl-CoA:carnitine CoA-transferase CaiB-like acyl-CoA transferase